MKTIGLLGGMTYYSTVLYYTQINARVQAVKGGSNAASLLLHSFNFAEISKLFLTGRWDTATIKFVEAGNHMKLAGAQGLAIGCNIGHKVAKDVEAQVGLPVLHIAEYTAQAVKQRGLKKVALLATKAAMEGDFISGPLGRSAGVEVLVPGPDDRQSIDDAVFRELALGEVKPKTKETILRILSELIERGAEAVVLACTDLQFVIKPEEVSVPVLDTLELHAKGVADWSMEE